MFSKLGCLGIYQVVEIRQFQCFVHLAIAKVNNDVTIRDAS